MSKKSCCCGLYKDLKPNEDVIDNGKIHKSRPSTPGSFCETIDSHQIQQLKIELENAKLILKQLEYMPIINYDDPNKIQEVYLGCPICKGHKSIGHTIGCTLFEMVIL